VVKVKKVEGRALAIAPLSN